MAKKAYAWTATSIKAIQNTPPEKPKRVFEGGDTRGFYVQVTPKGTVTPGVQHYVAGKKQFTPVGPRLPSGNSTRTIRDWLHDARTAANSVRKAVDDGRLPSRHGKPMADDTVDVLLDVYLLSIEGASTKKAISGMLRKDVRPYIGQLPTGEVTVDHIADVFARVFSRVRRKNRVGDATVRKLRSILLTSFKIGLRFRGDAKLRDQFRTTYDQEPPVFALTHNPADLTADIARGKPRDRCLSHTEMRVVWDACSDETIEDRRLALVMKLLLLTGTRSGVICGLRWEEVKEDHIFIAAEERKNGRNKLRQDYRIPLTPAIHDVLAEAKLLFDGDHYVFPGASRSKMHHFTPGAAAQKLAEVRDRLGIDYFTIHTFRHTVNTELEGLSWEEDSQINDKRRHLLLGHVVSGDVNEKVYTHRSWLRMREKLTAALQEWHETLDAIVNAPEPTSISKARSAL